ncbi:MAG: hypothetical protein CK427_06180 [Leptospira sp.]|nr:MAG: hypothetical protein CK427_06180 [Leptospira sp.]
MNYKNPPIEEAIFDVKVENLNISSIEDLELFHGFIKDDYPKKKKNFSFTSSISLDTKNKVGSQTNSDLIGFVFLNESENEQIQLRLDGFTFNIVKSYKNWDIHFSKFLDHWSRYNELFKPNRIAAIATRYINKINLQIPFRNFEEYLTIIPSIPASLPQSFANFYLQMHIPCSDNIRQCVMSEYLGPLNEGKLPIFLDINVFQDNKIENSIKDFELNFNEIRKIKNEIFESCITQKTRELFV